MVRYHFGKTSAFRVHHWRSKNTTFHVLGFFMTTVSVTWCGKDARGGRVIYSSSRTFGAKRLEQATPETNTSGASL